MTDLSPDSAVKARSDRTLPSSLSSRSSGPPLRIPRAQPDPRARHSSADVSLDSVPDQHACPQRLLMSMPHILSVINTGHSRATRQPFTVTRPRPMRTAPPGTAGSRPSSGIPLDDGAGHGAIGIDLQLEPERFGEAPPEIFPRADEEEAHTARPTPSAPVR